MIRDHKRLLECLDQFNSGNMGFFGTGKHWQEYDKLISTQAGNNPPVADALFQPVGHRNNEVVTHLMPKGVINALEVIDIYENYRRVIVVYRSFGERPFEQFEKKSSIGEAGESVMFHEVLNAGFVFPALGDVNDSNDCGVPVLISYRFGIGSHDNLSAVGLEMDPVLVASVRAELGSGVLQNSLTLSRRPYVHQGHLQKLISGIAIMYKCGRVDIDIFVA